MRIDFSSFAFAPSFSLIVTMNRAFLPALGLLLASFTHGFAANLLVNGDFESGGISGNANGTMAYWTNTTYSPNYTTGQWLSGQYNGGADVAFNIVNNGGDNIAVQNNANTAGGTDADGFAQVIDISGLTASDAGTYQLSFDWRANSANLSGFSYGLWSTTAPSSGGRFEAFNSTTAPGWPNPKDFISPTSISAIAANTFQTEAITFSLTSVDIATYDYLSLNFASDATGDTQLAFNNMSLDVIPEPGSAFLFLGGLALLGLRRRRLR